MLLSNFHPPGLPVGLPFFVEEPQGLNVTRGAPFSLACNAVGPPQPVSIVWHKDGNALWPVTEVLSPSVLNVDGKAKCPLFCRW